MKNINTLLSVALLLCMPMCLQAQNVTIPDDEFKYALLNHFPVIDTNGNGEISTYEAQQFTGTLQVYFYGIYDLTGIEAFTNITGLNCASNNLTTFDLSNNTQLQYLGCGGNNITSLNLTALTQLETLDCGINLLTTLDVSALPVLKELFCYNNQLTTLDTSANPLLETLTCQFNPLQSLNLSTNTMLTWLWCNNCQLSSLDLSTNANLIRLACYSNQLTYLNVANGNNSNVTEMTVDQNPDLTCIQHDVGFVPMGVWYKDNTASWSTDCPSLSTATIAVSESAVKLYPNPAKDVVHIQAENLKLVVVYNMQGKQVLATANPQFSIANLTAGIYLVKIENTQGTSVYKKLMVR